MLELRIMQGAQALPLFDLPAHLGKAAAAREIGDTIDGLIAYLDELAGDPDLELSGDETDFDNAEDDFADHGGTDWAAGCPITDPGEDDDPAGGDANDVGEVEEWRPDGIEAARPRYGINQSRGPTNARRAHHDYLAAIHARSEAEWAALRAGGVR